MKHIEKYIVSTVLVFTIFFFSSPAVMAAAFQYLSTAAFEGQIEAINELISEEADVNAKDKNGETALMAASMMGQAPGLPYLKAVSHQRSALSFQINTLPLLGP